MMAAGLDSIQAGFLVTSRWIRRGAGPYWLVFATLVILPLSLWAGPDMESRRVAFIELMKGLTPLFALFVGAYACQQLREGGGASPLEGMPIQPFFYLLGQVFSLGAAVLLGVAMMILPAVLVPGTSFTRARLLETGRIEGKTLLHHGQDWALPSTGRIRLEVPALVHHDWTLESQLVSVYFQGDPSQPLSLEIEGLGPIRIQSVEPEVPFRISVPRHYPGGEVIFRCRTPGLGIRLTTGSTLLLSSVPASIGSVASKFWGILSAQALLLMMAAVLVSLLVSPPIAVLASLTLWLVGWSARFLTDYARFSGFPSIFRAWSGTEGVEAAGDSTGMHWLADIFGLIPDMRMAGISDALVRGLAPPWGLVVREMSPLLLTAAGLALGIALLGLMVWRRTPGRIPGERGIS